jgi:SAM-dependent methyltransferase
MESERPEYGLYAGSRFVAALLALGGAGVALFVLGLVSDGAGRVPLVLGGAALGVLFLWPGLGLLLSNRSSTRGGAPVYDFLDPAGGQRILDCGCGTGRHAIPLARAMGPGSDLTGLDVFDRRKISNNSAERVRRNARIEGVADRMRVVVASATDVPFASRSFDVVTCMAVLHAMGDGRERALSEMRRVMRPDGLLYLYEMDRVAGLPTLGLLAPVLYRSASHWRAMVERHGFEVEGARRERHRLVFLARPA